MKKTMLIEAILVLLTGVALTILKYFEGGMDSVNELAGAVETNGVVIYSSLLFLALAVISRHTRKNYGINVYHHKENMKFAEEVFEGIGSGLLSIYRLIVGILITVPFLWRISEPATFKYINAGLIFLYGIAFFIGLLILSWINNRSKSN
jgi:di/tricarboxylate transporter